MAQVTFIGRTGCHLCADAHRIVLEARRVQPFDLLELDVDSDLELRAEYGYQVPVVLIDGEMHSYFEVDRTEFINAVANAKSTG